MLGWISWSLVCSGLWPVFKTFNIIVLLFFSLRAFDLLGFDLFFIRPFGIQRFISSSLFGICFASLTFSFHSFSILISFTHFFLSLIPFSLSFFFHPHPFVPFTPSFLSLPDLIFHFTLSFLHSLPCTLSLSLIPFLPFLFNFRHSISPPKYAWGAI